MSDAMVSMKDKMIADIDSCESLTDMMALANILEWMADIMAGQGYAYKGAELAQRMYDCIVDMLWEHAEETLERLYYMVQSFNARQSIYMRGEY